MAKTGFNTDTVDLTGLGFTDATAPVTRLQAIGVLARLVAADEGYDLKTLAESDVTAALAAFGDAGSIGANVKKEVAFAVLRQLVKGNNQHLLLPGTQLTRIAAAAFIVRAMGPQLRVDDTENGATMTVKVGDIIQVVLKGNPTTGYTWTAALSEQDASILEQMGEYGYVSDSDLIGSGGTFTFRFRALKAGEATLKLVYSRPWESVPPLETFSMTVKVAEKPLEGTAWRLEGWTLSSLNPADFEITASFTDGRVGGKGGVNSYSGPYTVGRNGFFSVGDIISTLMAGPENAMRAESAYYQLLHEAKAYRLTDGHLTLLDANGNEIVDLQAGRVALTARGRRSPHRQVGQAIDAVVTRARMPYDSGGDRVGGPSLGAPPDSDTTTVTSSTAELVFVRVKQDRRCGVCRVMDQEQRQRAERTERSFEAFFEGNYRRLVRSLAVASGNEELAEDVVQQAFAQLWAEWPRISRYQSPADWVARVAISRLRDHQRSFRRFVAAAARWGGRPARTRLRPRAASPPGAPRSEGRACEAAPAAAGGRRPLLSGRPAGRAGGEDHGRIRGHREPAPLPRARGFAGLPAVGGVMDREEQHLRTELERMASEPDDSGALETVVSKGRSYRRRRRIVRSAVGGRSGRVGGACGLRRRAAGRRTAERSGLGWLV